MIDGANAIYRAFFAIPNLRAPDGTPTNAAYGFVTMLAKVLREEQPTHVAIAADPKGGSFRKKLFPEYKAGRDKQPEDLGAQFPLVDELCDAFGVRKIEAWPGGWGIMFDDIAAGVIGLILLNGVRLAFFN